MLVPLRILAYPFIYLYLDFRKVEFFHWFLEQWPRNCILPMNIRI